MERKFLVAILFLTPLVLSLFTPKVLPVEDNSLDTLAVEQFEFQDDVTLDGYVVKFFNGTNVKPTHARAVIQVRWPTRDTFQTSTRVMKCNGKTGEVVTCKSSKTVPGGSVVRSVPGEPVIRGLYGR